MDQLIHEENRVGASSGPYDAAFYRSQMEGSYQSAKRVLGALFGHHSPSSVVDFGCGVGTWLRASTDLGAKRVLGLDGDYVNRQLLQIAFENFRPSDLANPSLSAGEVFDLAISLEVAEHLPRDRAAAFVRALCRASDVVLFAAAVPGQRGTEHVNEQFPSYWIPLFGQHGHRCYDFLRPIIWRDTSIDVWYRQNILVFSKTAVFPDATEGRDDVDRIHPELWADRGNVHEGMGRIASVIRFEAAWMLPISVRSAARRLLRR